MPGTSHIPLAGAILCFTSVAPEQRTELSVIGTQMGAQIKLDLTSDVTHLIVGNTNSAKYRYVAKAREDVKVLFPEWIHAVQKVWMAGEDAKVVELEQKWRLPAFYGLKICLTGFDNPEQRKFIQETVVSNGAEYHGDLTKAVTHLIAASPSGSKYEHAVNWRLKIVTWEWFEQSRERGMALDEAFYHPTMPVGDRGVGAWDRHRSTSPMLGKRVRAAEQIEAINPLRRKLRRSASTRLSGQTEALWAGITAAGLEKKANDEDDWTEANANEPEPLPEDDGTTTPVEARVDMQPRKDPAVRTRGPFSDDHDGIFAGRVIFLDGFDRNKTNILREHLDSNGAVVVGDATELDNFSADDLGEGFVLVPHDAQTDLTSLPEAAGTMSLVTNWWVERCLHGKTLVDPTDCVLCRPFDKPSISGFEGLTINSTGFAGIELLHITKVVALFGATYDETLSTTISVLVCHNHNPNPEKLKYATEKGIHVVHANWLWNCIKRGEIQPYDEYSLTTTASQSQNRRRRPNQSSKEVPTAPVSKEESFRLQQKKAQRSQPTSDARGSLRRPGTLELSASGNLTPATTSSSTNPGTTTNQSELEFEHDAQLPEAFDGAADSPLLQDVDLDAKGHETKASSARAESADISLNPAPSRQITRPLRQPSPDSVLPPDTEPTEPTEASADPLVQPPPEKDYSDIMLKLLATRKACAPAEKEEVKGRRRRRPLGRAQSGRSNASTAADDVLSRQSSASKVVEEEEMGEDEDLALRAFKPPEPSQQLGWDSPGAQRAREKMIRAIGGNVAAETVIEETRVVKDAVGESAVGLGRASRKKRG
ncbi:hypothetical protein BU23DRAFT_544568 [Bimuria novae-zelandiae CBS 107.79]|uniref:BRCT domain-containing protein n=1 Tax=Bimuria novae-zelandiae CBS 107.79 TaxID=1447943 RepID=A0A6A5UTZ4_9PLEO|nr:hypothetical protein BU23DRAFT_544568 [Bimuria novae-zelandiae CBS 107.79]